MTAHRFWRINITAVDGDARSSISEVQLRTTAWDASSNVATGGTAAASNAAFGAASNAFDGNPTTNWRANAIAAWLSYDLGTAQTITQVVIMGAAAAIGESPKNFTVEYSDDNSAWTTWATIIGQTGWEAAQWVNSSSGKIPEIRAFGVSGRQNVTGAARYWAAKYPSSGTGSTTVRIVQIEYRATPGGSNISGGTISAPVSSGSTVANNARDGNLTTYWQSGTSYPQGLLMDWGSGASYSVAEIALTANNGAGPAEAISFYRSYDNYVYELVWTTATQSAWSDGETRTFTDPGYVAAGGLIGNPPMRAGLRGLGGNLQG